MQLGTDADWGLALYTGGHAAACLSIPQMGWIAAAPLADRLGAALAAAGPGFLDCRYLAAAVGERPEALLGKFGRLARLARHSDEIALIDGRIVAAPASMAATWEASKAAVLALIPGSAPIAYGRVRGGTTMPATSLKTILQNLADDGAIAVEMPAGGAQWEAMTFRRPQYRAA